MFVLVAGEAECHQFDTTFVAPSAVVDVVDMKADLDAALAAGPFVATFDFSPNRQPVRALEVPLVFPPSFSLLPGEVLG